MRNSHPRKKIETLPMTYGITIAADPSRTSAVPSTRKTPQWSCIGFVTSELAGDDNEDTVRFPVERSFGLNVFAFSHEGSRYAAANRSYQRGYLSTLLS